MNLLQGLNPQQQKAATHMDGPLLILAGAGSGKTRVLTNRIAWLIGEKGVAPWNICAITFTNKAAQEMRSRVDRMVGFGAEAVHVATFHSTCVRILRQYIDRLGYERNFDIYDTDDTRNLMKDICKHLEINTKLYKEKMFLAQISHQKDELISPAECRENALGMGDRDLLQIADVYAEYQKRLERSNAVDFDDLIALTVRLLRENPDVLEHYQNRWRYLMVDEYQDTNKAQFVFVALLAKKTGNLCVVGDDDQSIYRFRGADIGNILNFEQIFPNTQVIRLEQNYRSTQNILDAANGVIANNVSRKQKRLWTDNGTGDPVSVRRFDDARAEAKFIVDDLGRKKRQGIFAYKDSAVLYRTNAQSRALEEQLLYENIPYTIIGGTNFYARREIKDILAYLKTVDNSRDDIAVKRIINVPKRGIGATSISRIDSYAQTTGSTFFDICRMADKVPGIGRGGLKIRSFANLIRTLREEAAEQTPTEVIRNILERTGYAEELRLEGTDESADRLANIEELMNKAASYEEAFEADAAMRPQDPEVSGETEMSAQLNLPEMNMPADDESQTYRMKPTLRGFLEEVALVADIDSFDGEDDRVPLMTLHAAKGLEFPNVYLAGMDEGLFPSYQSTMSGDPSDMEEERRLCYVGITRAKEHLTMTGARMRMLRGQMEWFRESRFLGELPPEVIDTMPERSPSRSPFSSSPKPWQMPRKSQPAPKPYFVSGKQIQASSGDLGYGVGDTVRHVKFGQGTVTAIRDGGRDKEVTVEFDNYGVKKMFAGFAKLVKV